MKDSHVHTPFCQHGAEDPLEDYVKAAIHNGLTELVFTEHAPLPIEDTVPEKNSSMLDADVGRYLEEIRRLKDSYQNQIAIHAGFEVDYLEGEEKKTSAFLAAYPETIPYSILSVHFLKLEDGFFCIDYDAGSFLSKAREVGLETLYFKYEETVKRALSLPFGQLTPKKIGHLNLIHKFEKRYAIEDPIDWPSLLRLAKTNGYRLDYNFAGIDKIDYGHPYPNPAILEIARSMDLILETGSDAHHPSEVGRYFTSPLI